MSAFTLLFLLSAHFVADFVLQTDWQAKNKSTNWTALHRHVMVYATVLGVAVSFMGLSAADCVGFWSLTYCTHFVTDAITSRINSRLWQQGRVHGFFVGVGADQLIHAWTLTLTWLCLHP